VLAIAALADLVTDETFQFDVLADLAFVALWLAVRSFGVGLVTKQVIGAIVVLKALGAPPRAAPSRSGGTAIAHPEETLVVACAGRIAEELKGARFSVAPFDLSAMMRGGAFDAHP